MVRLPLVKKEISHSMRRNLNGRSVLEKQRYLLNFWEILRYEQPDLTKMIFQEMDRLEGAMEQGAFLQGVCFTYMALHSQLEANEFSDAWDLEEDIPFR
tara:strand:- start:872 stop:1168 length:297 start_codon:yes stop_codon:yes gene_type:complete